MSAFITRIPVNIAELRSELPKGSDFESLTFNAQTCEIELRWSHRDLLTPYSTHYDFPRAALQASELPAGIRLRERTVAPAPVAKSVDKVLRRRVRKET